MKLERLENAADDVYPQAISARFAEERSPTNILKWKEIYELLEAVTDRCGDVANGVQAIALRHA